MNSVIVKCKPSPGESLLGYLERSTRANFYSQIKWLLDGSRSFEGEIRADSKKLKLLYTGERSSERLEVFCGASASSLQAMTYKPLAEDPSKWRFGCSVVPAGALVPLRRRVCPACIAEGRFRHRILDIAFYTACHRHNCWLVGECPDCGRTQGFTDCFNGPCDRCNQPSQWAITSADPAAVRVSNEIARLDAGQADEGSVFDNLGDLIAGLLMMCRIALPDSVMGRFELSLPLRTDSELRTLSGQAWAWIESRERFEKALHKEVTERRAAFPNCADTMLYFNVRRQVEGLSGWRIGQVLGAWLAEFQDNGQSAALDAERLIALRSEVHTLRTAAEIMEVSFERVRLLEQAGLFGRQERPEDRTISEVTISAGAIDEFLGRLRVCARDIDAAWQADSLDVEQATRFGNGGAIGLRRLIDSIVDGQIRARLPRGENLKALIVSKADLENRQFIGTEGLLTSVLAGKRLKLENHVVCGLLRVGLLPTVPVMHSTSRRRWVRVDDVERFERDFVFGRRLAEQWGVYLMHLMDRLGACGILPVSGPRIDNGANYVYRRADVLDEQVQAALSEAQTRATIHPSLKERSGKRARLDLLTSAQVASRLGMTRRQLSGLVRRGVFVRYTAGFLAQGTHYFLRQTIDQFEQKFRLNPELMPLDEALKLLKVDRHGFHFDYVRTHRLEIVDDHAGSQYVRRAAVTAIESNSDEWVTQRQARLRLDVDQLQLTCLIRKIEPSAISGSSFKRLYNLAALESAMDGYKYYERKPAVS